jgi:DNA-binding LacI/PurR family transcriptional regulator
LHAGGLIVNLFPLLDAEEQRETTLRELAGWRPSAIVLFGAYLSDNMRETLQNTRSPSIELLNYEENGPLACVGCDQRAAALKLSQHLLDRGYQRLAYVHSANPLMSMNVKRLTGFADGIKGVGGAFYARGGDDQFAAANGPDVRGLEIKAKPTFIDGFELMSRLAAADQIPDALLFGSDMVAVGALQFCLSNGLQVPHDVALCAFDGTELTSVVQPGLTSLDAPFEKVAQMGAQEILRLTQDDDTEIRRICVEAEVVHRGST